MCLSCCTGSSDFLVATVTCVVWQFVGSLHLQGTSADQAEPMDGCVGRSAHHIR